MKKKLAFSELVVLNNLLDGGHSSTLSFGKGILPDGLHDFVNEGVWELEVKKPH